MSKQEDEDMGNPLSPVLYKGQILRDTLQGNLYRILYIPPENNSGENGYWIRVDTSSNIPKAFSLQDVQFRIATRVLENVAGVNTETDILDSDLSNKGIVRRERAWNLIQKIVTVEPDIYILSKRADLMKQVEATSGVKVNNLYNYLGKYWRSGFQKNALAPDYRKCGGARHVGTFDSRAGKKKREGANGKVLTEKDYEIFRKAIARFYHGTEKNTLVSTYNSMLATYYVRKKSEEDPTLVTMQADEKPSFFQFYYWHRKHGNMVEDAEKRSTEREFDLKYRAITGKTEAMLYGPGHSYQIDATIGDFYLVMKSDRSRVVGRPIIVFLKDAWSRIITGMTVTLENSSSSIWKLALLNALSSKAEYCRKFGVEITEEQWPCRMLPSSITTDNGEFAARSIDEIVSSLGITVEYCPSYRGDLKGIIERTFKTYQLELKPYVPGHVDSDAGTRGAPDYRKNACIDIESFTTILIRLVLFYNNSHYLDSYERNDDMRQDKVPSVPLQLWNYGIAHYSGALKIANQDICRDVLLSEGTATVTERGIDLNGLRYTCDLAVQERWFERARIEGSYTISIRYNPLDSRHIYIKGSDGKYTTCMLVDSCHQFECKTKEDAEADHQKDLDAAAAHTQEEDQARLELDQFIKTIISRCKNEGSNKSKIGEVLKQHTIPENREEEKRNLSGETEARKTQSKLGPDQGGHTSQASPDPEQARPKSYSAVSDEIDELLAEQLFEAFGQANTVVKGTEEANPEL